MNWTLKEENDDLRKENIDLFNENQDLRQENCRLLRRIARVHHFERKEVRQYGYRMSILSMKSITCPISYFLVEFITCLFNSLFIKQKQRQAGYEDGACGSDSSLCGASGVNLMQGRDGKRSRKRKADSVPDENESEPDSVKVMFVFFSLPSFYRTLLMMMMIF